MRKKTASILFLSCLLCCCSPGSRSTLSRREDDVKTKITILQMNDVYELDPVSGGSEGGLARVAALRAKLLEQNPNTITVLAGDLLSPSALGTAPFEDGRLNGRQIVAAMNVLGLDYITFGNHEFDLGKASLHDRIMESKFTWISSNCLDRSGRLLPKVADSRILEMQGVRIGIFGLTIANNKADYVACEDPFAAAQKKVAELRPQVDILVALTHLNVQDDFRLAGSFPEIDLILGGHEHENMQYWRGKNFTPIFKADANARTVYVHDLLYDRETRKRLSMHSRLERITADLPDDKNTAQTVEKWRKIAYDGFQKAGFAPERTVTTTDADLDGLESSVRNKSTRLTELIAQAMLSVAEGTQLSIYNSGAVRLDDVIPAGPVTEYDVIRMLPFGGSILITKMKGSLLKRTLDQGLRNKGGGAYLQTGNVGGGDDKPWTIGGRALDESAEYSVAILDYLLKKGDDNLDFLVNSPNAPILESKGDIRSALIAELKKTFGK